MMSNGRAAGARLQVPSQSVEQIKTSKQDHDQMSMVDWYSV